MDMEDIDERNKRKRAQVARACQKCASSKRRCSGTFPCDRCLHLGVQDSCIEVRVKRKGVVAQGLLENDDDHGVVGGEHDHRKRRARHALHHRGSAQPPEGNSDSDSSFHDAIAAPVSRRSTDFQGARPADIAFTYDKGLSMELYRETAGPSAANPFMGVDLLLRASGERVSSVLSSAAAIVAGAICPAAAASSSPLVTRRAAASSANIPATTPDIGITAESDVHALLPYPAWSACFDDGGVVLSGARSVSPPQRICANSAGCDLFNCSAQDLPYLIYSRSLLWLHPDDIVARAVAAAHVRQAQCRYYEWTGRYIRTVPTADEQLTGEGDNGPRYKYHLFFAVERIFCSYYASGAIKQCLSIFSMVQDANEEVDPSVINAPTTGSNSSVAAGTLHLTMRRLAQQNADDASMGASSGVNPSIGSSVVSSSGFGGADGLGSALTSFGTHSGSFTEQQKIQHPLRSRVGSEVRERDLLPIPPATRWPSYSQEKASAAVGAVRGVGTGSGRCSFSDVLRGLSGDWSVADASASAPASGGNRSDSFLFGLGTGEDSSILLPAAAWGMPAAQPSVASLPHQFSVPRRSSGAMSGLFTSPAPSNRSSFSSGGNDHFFGGPPASAASGSAAPHALASASSWATDLAALAAMAAAGGRSPAVGVGADLLVDSTGGVADGGQMWETDSRDAPFRRFSRASADYTFGFTALEIGHGGVGQQGMQTTSSLPVASPPAAHIAGQR